MDEKIYTLQQAAAYLTIHRNTLSALIREGKIKKIHLTARRRGILHSELNRYLKSLGE